MSKTRKDSFCFVLGSAGRFKENMLPTYADIMKHYLWIRQELLWQKNGKDPSTSEVSDIVLEDVKNIWNKTTIPTVSDQQIKHLIKTFYMKYKTLKKSKNHIKRLKVQAFRKNAEQKLFDISICKCSLQPCKCKIKVPITERDFLNDQRTERKMCIGSVDIKETRKFNLKLNKKINTPTTTQKCNESENINGPSTSVIKFEADSDIESIEVEKKGISTRKLITPEEVPNNLKEKQELTKQMRLSLPMVASVCDRIGISDRSAAMLVSATLHDIGLVSSANPTKVVDRCKVRRERQKLRSKLQNFSGASIRSLYFDGRKDKTLIQEKEGGRFYRRTISQEHIVLLEEPNSVYMGHVTPNSGSAENIRKSIINFLNIKSIDLTHLIAIGCDGTVTNTGHKNGIISQIEKYVGHSLHWFICLLHMNELPLRHLFQDIDGSTTGPKQFSGEIGKELNNCEKNAIVEFNRIQTDVLPKIAYYELSSDQKYLYDICCAVTNGHIEKELANRNPGKLCHSRWLTLANRLLRLYVSTKNPSQKLILLANFVIKVYAPTWFEIKLKPAVKDGPVHFFNIIRKCQYLPDNLKCMVQKVLQRNGFFAHSENILLAMIEDESSEIRKLGLKRIADCRKAVPASDVRTFTIPKINFSAKCYYNLINWNETIYEPPITKKIGLKDLEEMISTNEKNNFPSFPCHTQAVERHVKLVTEASLAVVGAENRDGFIRSRIKSREEIPKFGTKMNFFVNNSAT